MIITFVAAGQVAEAARPPSSPPPDKCVVWLHGQGGTSARSYVSGGLQYLFPHGNVAVSRRGYKWLYFPDDQYAAARQIVQDAITSNGCARVVIDGFSNGGGFAGKLFCRGENFGGKVVGYVADDPVTDHGVEPCRPTVLNAAMYWTGALDYAGAGFDCVANGWTCDGGTLIGRDNYATALGVIWQQSPETRHTPYLWPPEVAAWLAP